ncbi:MAG TPA: 50S ribosomal protein L17 [Herpetosiphonaceae bacterium]
MRHRVAGKKLNRTSKERKHLYRALMSAILEHRKITTTHAKAQAIRPEIEKLITMARHVPTTQQIEAAPEAERDMLRHRRSEVFRRGLMELGNNKQAVQRLLEVAPDYADRPGGYTRIIKIGQRKGDAAEMSVIELV